MNFARAERFGNRRANSVFQNVNQCRIRGHAWGCNADNNNSHAFQRVWRSDGSRVDDFACQGHGPLDFRWADAFARDVQRVVGPAQNIPCAILIVAHPVAVTPDTGKGGPVGFQISRLVLPDGRRQPQGGLGYNQFADLAQISLSPIRAQDLGAHPQRLRREPARRQSVQYR